MKKYILAFIMLPTINLIACAAQPIIKDTNTFIKLNLENKKQMITILCSDIYEKKQADGVILPPAAKCPKLMQPIIVNTIHYYAKTLPSTINQSFAIAFGETIATQSQLRYLERYAFISRNTFINRIKTTYSAENLCRQFTSNHKKTYPYCLTHITQINQNCLSSYIKHMPKKLNAKDQRVFSKMIHNCNQQSYIELIS